MLEVGWYLLQMRQDFYNIKLKKLFHQQSVKWNPETTFKGHNHIENGSFRCMDSKLGKPEIVKCLMPSNLPSPYSQYKIASSCDLLS